jgi:hypothetical protein
MSSSRSIKDIILTVISVAVVVGFLAFVAVRTADVYYKAAWIVTHFPPPGNLCSEAFCVRSDTSKPDRSFGELHYAYCSQHLASGFQGRGGRSAAVAVLSVVFIFICSFVSVPILGALFRVIAWPVLIPLRLMGKLPSGRLLPFARYADAGRSAPGDWLEPAGMWTGALVAVVAMALYCWW